MHGARGGADKGRGRSVRKHRAARKPSGDTSPNNTAAPVASGRHKVVGHEHDIATVLRQQLAAVGQHHPAQALRGRQVAAEGEAQPADLGMETDRY